jgi:hypothetical protein
VQKGGKLLPSRQNPAHVPVTAGLQSAEEIMRPNRSEREDRDVALLLDDRISTLIQTE